MLVHRIAVTVTHRVRIGAAGGQRRRGPEGPAVLVADEHGLARRIADGIVSPGRQTVVVAVLRPGVTRPGLGAGEPEAGVRHDIRPGRRGQRGLRIHAYNVLALVVRKPAEPVEELEAAIGAGGRDRHRSHDRRAAIGDFRSRRSRRVRHLRARQLIAQPAVVGVHHRACRRAQQQLVVGRHQIGAAEKDAAGFVDPVLLRTAVDQPLQLLLQGMEIAGRVVVQDDEVERQALEAQVLVSLQELDDQRRGRLAGDTGQQDREIPRNPVLPQLALTLPVLLDGVPMTQPRVSGEHAAAETLKGNRVFDRQVEMPQLDLAVRAGQRERARDRAAIVVLLDQVQRRFLALGVRGREREPRRRARRETHGLAETDDRIEDRSCRARELGGGRERARPLQRAATADEPCAIGFVLRGDAHAAASAEHVHQVQSLTSRAWAAHADQRIPLRHAAGLDEQVAERRVGQVGVGRREDDLGVAGELEAASHGGVIGHGDPPQLRIVFRRDDDFRAGLDAVVQSPPRRAIRREGHLVFLGLPGGRLVGRGPDVAGVEVADVTEGAPGVGRDVLAPARQRHLLTPAVAAAGVGDHHDVGPVRQQVRARAERVRRRVAAQRRRRPRRAVGT